MPLVSGVQKHINTKTDLNDSVRRLTTHIVDSVLITEPVRTFDLYSRELDKFVKEM